MKQITIDFNDSNYYIFQFEDIVWAYEKSEFQYAVGAIAYYIEKLCAEGGEFNVRIKYAGKEKTEDIITEVEETMTNDDVIKRIESQGKFGIQSITKEMDEFIKKNYTKGNSDGKFYKVYRDGNDAKYGHYMVNPRTMYWRDSTFDEFYGSVVD